MSKFSNFAALASYVANTLDDDEQAGAYAGTFIEPNEMAKLSVVEDAEKIAMPCPEQSRAAVEMMMQTLFDVFRDSRMEEFATDLAWGFCNSFHMVAKRIENREDDAAKKLGEMARAYDPSEIYANELEDTQLHCQTLQACREAMECMRDHAAAVYRVETGRSFSSMKGSRVSSKLNASMIDARDYLAARARTRREQHAPEGPVVAFSGGSNWSDHEMLWARLDQIKRRIPEMILATTAQMKGCDAIAAAWAAARDVKVIQFRLDRSKGLRGAFLRNERIISLGPVEAIICEGSGVQANLSQRLRSAGTPVHVFRIAEQRAITGRAQRSA